MRIIAGTLGGRRIEAPKGFKTHPMSERVRAALFNILGDINGYEVFDPFAGSGALSFEAISRGAASAIALDRDRSAFKVLQSNVSLLKLEDQVKVINAPASSWSDNNEQKKFDLILCDPPYNDMQLSTVFKMHKHLKANGTMILSHSGREPVSTVNGVVVVDNRNYGDAALTIYRLA